MLLIEEKGKMMRFSKIHGKLMTMACFLVMCTTDLLKLFQEINLLV